MSSPRYRRGAGPSPGWGSSPRSTAAPRSRCCAASAKRGLSRGCTPSFNLCNAVSLAFAIPVAVFDVSKITGDLEVRYAAGDEDYLTFSGEVEHPSVHEVIFSDTAGQAHARRWSNRQSGLSAVRNPTTVALIVAEAMHGSAPSDMPELTTALAGEVGALWGRTPAVAVLSQSSPRFTVGP